MSNFKFTPEIHISDLTKQLVELGGEEKNIGPSSISIIITEELKNNILDDKIQINGDCRIYSHLIGAINENNPFILLPKKMDFMDLFVPKSCLYITVSDKFREHNMQRCLGSTQGQWVVKNITNNKYTGLTSEGILNISIEEWIRWYKNKAEIKIKELEKKMLDSNQFNSPILGLLSCITKINNGVNVQVVRYESYRSIEVYNLNTSDNKIKKIDYNEIKISDYFDSKKSNHFS